MKQNTKIRQLLHLEQHSKRDFIFPIVLCLSFILGSIIFFKKYSHLAIWSSMEKAGGNAFKFCELNHLGTSLVQSSNTWSNIGFLLVGLLILFTGLKDSRTKRANKANLLIQFPMFSILMGISILYLFVGSFFYHASVTYFFQMLDQTGMYAILLSFTGYNVFRIWPKIKHKQKGQVSSHNIILVGIMLFNALFIGYLWQFDVNILYTTLVFMYMFFTLLYNRKNPSIPFSKKILNFAVGIYLISMSIWILDRTKVLCDPESIFQGHAIWHLLNAVAVLFVYLHYRSENLNLQYKSNSK